MIVPDFKLKSRTDSEGNEIKKLSNQQVTFNVIDKAVELKFPQGLIDGDRHMWASIVEKLDAMINENQDMVLFDTEQEAWLNNLFKGTAFPQDYARMSVKVEQAISSTLKIEG